MDKNGPRERAVFDWTGLTGRANPKYNTDMPDIFEILILIGRPASGKSEIIDLLTRETPDVRRRRYHLGELDVLDDFPMLWAWFEEDDILARMGLPRLHSDERGYFLRQEFWHVLIERLALDYHKRLRDRPGYHQHFTTLIEFSRGSEHGGYRAAFAHLPDDLLRRAAVLYVNVSFAESLRKNRRRFNPDKPDSILEHGLSDEKMERLYREDDFLAFAAGDPAYLAVRDLRVPYVLFENEDDVTTGQPDKLRARLDQTLARLWALHLSRP